MVAQGGLEPPALGYEPSMLAATLPRNSERLSSQYVPVTLTGLKLVRTSRIELETPGWKPGTLPLRHARVILVGVVGVEPTLFTTWDEIYSLGAHTP